MALPRACRAAEPWAQSGSLIAPIAASTACVFSKARTYRIDVPRYQERH
ncbi:hypothetical protein AB0M48_10150 [Lentzea sp. NPDC051208]